MAPGRRQPPYVVSLLLIVALAAAGTIAAKQKCHQAHRLKPNAGRGNCLLDKRQKFILCGSPKAAATTSFMIMLHVAKETTVANEWLIANGLRDANATSTSAAVHRYRISEFQQAAAHSVKGGIAARAAKLCTTSGWLCAIIVRNPLDRAISSFLHIAKTGIGVLWPELVAVVRDVALVRAGNYTFRQHVRALELFAARMHIEGTTSDRDKWASNHVLPQSPRWLHSLIRPRGKAAAGKAAKLAGAVKLVPLDSLAKSLAAVDAHFRHDRKLGLDAVTIGLHSSHWVSAGPGAAANDTLASSRNATATMVAPVDAGTAANGTLGTSARNAIVTGAAAAPHDRRLASEVVEQPPDHTIDADTFASVLCGLGARGGFEFSNNGMRHANCLLANNTYARMQAADPVVWARIRCLFHHDFQLYDKHVCAQGWLQRRCPTCLERPCGGSEGAGRT
jgi:hypothetical protein